MEYPGRTAPESELRSWLDERMRDLFRYGPKRVCIASNRDGVGITVPLKDPAVTRIMKISVIAIRFDGSSIGYPLELLQCANSELSNESCVAAGIRVATEYRRREDPEAKWQFLTLTDYDSRLHVSQSEDGEPSLTIVDDECAISE